MHAELLLALAARWLHILAAMAAVGGTMFMRLALLPSVSVLSDDARKQLHEAVRARWGKVVMAAIAFLLISGVYNFIFINRGLTSGSIAKPLYHGLFLVKFLLALCIFFIASALLGRSAGLAKIRQNARTWLTVNLVLAVLVVCISGYLRLRRDRPGAAARPQPSVAERDGQAHF